MSPPMTISMETNKTFAVGQTVLWNANRLTALRGTVITVPTVGTMVGTIRLLLTSGEKVWTKASELTAV